MSISNKVIVDFWRGDGHSLDEIDISFRPINFNVSASYFDSIMLAAVEGIAEYKPEVEVQYEVIFRQVVERDGAGAETDGYFEQIFYEQQS